MNKVKALFPDNVEKIIISKDDYDRLTGELTLENIELKQEIERLNNTINDIKEYVNFLVIYNQTISGKFSETQWGQDILGLIGSDKE